MKKLIGYCGLDCEKCDARIATLTGDDELRKKTAKLWSGLNGIEIPPEMIDCEGCRTDGKKTVYCSSLCEIRKCAAEKGFETCGQCEKLMTCETEAMVLSNNGEALSNLGK